MPDLDTAALRTLAATLTVPTIAEAPTQTVAIDADGERAVCDVVDGRHVWEDAQGYGWPDASMDGARITHISVPVETVTAVREALAAVANELVQARAERDAANAQAARALGAQKEAVRILSEQSFHHGRLDAAVPSLRLQLRQALEILAGKRDVGDWREDAQALLAGTADLDLSGRGGGHA